MFEFYERLILVIYLVLISCVNSGIMCGLRNIFNKVIRCY